MRLVSCTIVLLITLSGSDARTVKPSIADESFSSACDNCLLVAKKAEAALNSKNMFDEAHKLSCEACDGFPTILQDKCFKRSGDYLREARLILQELFQENKLCNSTGLCAKYESPTELYDKRDCEMCRKAAKKLLNRLKQHKMRKKIVRVLMGYCEEGEAEEDKCKEAVHEYGNLIMQKLEKFKSSDLCSMIDLCDDEEEEIAMEMFAN